MRRHPRVTDFALAIGRGEPSDSRMKFESEVSTRSLIDSQSTKIKLMLADTLKELLAGHFVTGGLG